MDKRSTKITSLLVTHQNRIKCLLNSFIDVKYNFGNCSILEMRFGREKNQIRYDIELIFDGFIKPDKKYYTSSPSSKKNLFHFQKIHRLTNSFLDIPSSSLSPNVEYIFFIIRHGNSTHNQYNIFTKIKSLYKTDTLLTEKGEEQAVEIGEFMKLYLQNQKLSIQNIFVSDLKRTRQTMTIVIHQIHPNTQSEMIVLPCAHELSYFNEANCDKKMINYWRGGFAGENKMRCDPRTCNIESNETNHCCRVKYGNTILRVNWDYYDSFYQNKQRKDIYYNESKETCFDSNMIKNAIDIINQL